jgi:hypothetical protein
MSVRTPNRLARLTRLGAVIACAALAPLAGCNDSPTTAGSPRLSILLTDAPGDFKTAVVTISEIYLQGEGGRVTLMSEPVTTNLLDLANSTATLVSDAVVPAGSYGELRFVVTGGYIEVETASGSEIYASSPNYSGLPAGAQVAGQLQMPSFSQSGLKVKLEGDGLTLADERKIMLVDFDVSQSFGREAGNAGRWVMHPVLTGAEIQASASLSVTAVLGAGVVLPTPTGGSAAATLAQVNAVLRNADGGEEKVLLTDTNADGTFEANYAYVLPGSYTVDLDLAGVTLTTSPVKPAPVSLVSGASAAVAFTITAAVPTPPPAG